MILWRGCEWFLCNELKRRPPETGTKIEGLRGSSWGFKFLRRHQNTYWQ